MTIPVAPISRLTTHATLTTHQLQSLAKILPEFEWFTNLTSAITRRPYQQDIKSIQAIAGLGWPEAFRDVTRAYVIARRKQLIPQALPNDTTRRKLAALSSLDTYLCERQVASHHLLLVVKRRARGTAKG